LLYVGERGQTDWEELYALLKERKILRPTKKGRGNVKAGESPASVMGKGVSIGGIAPFHIIILPLRNQRSLGTSE